MNLFSTFSNRYIVRFLCAIFSHRCYRETFRWLKNALIGLFSIEIGFSRILYYLFYHSAFFSHTLLSVWQEIAHKKLTIYRLLKMDNKWISVYYVVEGCSYVTLTQMNHPYAFINMKVLHGGKSSYIHPQATYCVFQSSQKFRNVGIPKPFLNLALSNREEFSNLVHLIIEDLP